MVIGKGSAIMWALLLMGSLAIGDHEPSRLAVQEAMTRTDVEPIGRIHVGMTVDEVDKALGEQSPTGFGLGTVYVFPYYKSGIRVVFCMRTIRVLSFEKMTR